ncbi:MAG: ribonuclease D [Pseudomonadota bacterium]
MAIAETIEPITTSDDLAALCERLRGAEYVTVDTEFMRETTFWPKLCLIQIASDTEAAVIDPIAQQLDLAPLFALFVEPAVLKVFHAARQDIEIFHHLSGRVPEPIFDTQVAAMVCGFGESVAYDSLVQRITGAQIDKSSRFTDWSARPLSDAQLRYALADVTHLRVVYAHLAALLEERGRADWVGEEMKVLASPETYVVEPENAWKRLKGRARQPVEFAVIQELAALREREAQSRDVPRNRILKDDLIYEAAMQRPQSVEAMAKLRSVPRGFERSRTGQAVVEAVKAVVARPASQWPPLPKRKANVEGVNAAVDLMKVLLKLCAEAEGVAPKVIATTDDLEALVSGQDTPALHGWRKTVFGDAAVKLRDGEVAIAFDGRALRTIDCERPVNPVPAAGSRRRRRKKPAAEGAG